MVPETLEPSLQLASAVLSQLNMPPDDVQEAIQEFRRAHMGELQVLLWSVWTTRPVLTCARGSPQGFWCAGALQDKRVNPGLWVPHRGPRRR